MSTQSKEKVQNYLELLKAKKKQILDLKKREARLQGEEEKYQSKLIQSERDNKIFYLGHEGKGYLGDHGKWELNNLQKQLMKAFEDPKKKVFTYTGANRIGKTFISLIMIYASLTGKWPWEPKEKAGLIWELFGWKPPIKVRWVGQDWEKHIKTVLIPKIKELWPKSHAIESRKNNVGVEAFWTEQTLLGTLEIMSNKQESALFEGWNGHLVVYDEPPQRDNRVACARGLIDFKGKEIFAMTLLKEAWVDQEVIKAVDEKGNIDMAVFNINGKIYDNIGFGIDEEGVNQFSKILREDEREARIKGVPSYLAGKILNFNRERHVMKRFEIPPSWPIDVAIDIGIAKPHDILFVATSPRGFYYACFEFQVRGDGTAIGEEVIRKIKKYRLRINRIIGDPLAKSDKNQENTTWEKMDTVLMKYGYMLEVGSKQKDDGILRINDLLSSEYGEPSLYLFSDMPRVIMQCDGWMYDENGVPKKYKMNEKPGDDQCENLYRIALLETEYSDPDFDYGAYQSSRSSSSSADGQDPITGY